MAFVFKREAGYRHPDVWITLSPRTANKPFNEEEAVGAYKRLIGKLPLANQYLLLYVLDLLTVFAKKSDKNMMPAASAFFPRLPTSYSADAFCRPQTWRLFSAQRY